MAAVKTLPTLELNFVTLAALNYTAAAALAIRAVPRPHTHTHTPESVLYIDLTSGKQKPKYKKNKRSWANECGTRRCLRGPNNARNAPHLHH